MSDKDELTLLKERATQMGIKFHPNIGLEKLKKSVNAGISGDEPEAPKASKAAKSTLPETKVQRQTRLRKEASKLVRVRVTNMNPTKKEWDGEVITASNSVVGTFKRFVPFNADEGWHVEAILLSVMKERKCQVFKTVKGSRGNKVRQGKLIPEFAIELLEPLTKTELADLAKRQAMANNLD